MIFYGDLFSPLPLVVGERGSGGPPTRFELPGVFWSMVRLMQLPPICVALGCETASELERFARRSAEAGERFFEFRLDSLDDPESGIGVIRRTVRRFPRVIILATCRRISNGGEFAGGLDEQGRLLDQAITAGAALVDVEIESIEQTPELIGRFRAGARLVLSYHDFEKTPPLDRVVSRLTKFPADIYKVATTAQKPSDNLRILELPLRHQGTPLAVMAMGETGTPTRVLGPSRGSLFTFSFPDPIAAGRGRATKPTAPGQMTTSLLRRRYRSAKLSTDTRVLGVVAYPAGHSMSPALHNRAFQSRRVDAVYLPFEVEPGRVGNFFRFVEALPVAGLSVTIPHKRSVMRYLNSLDPLAARIGAVNTIFRRKGKLRGTNTDAAGVTVPLGNRMPLKRASVLVVGNGGAARAAAFSLKHEGARVTLSGRNPGRVRKLAKACGAAALDREALAGTHFDALVHATPIGMHPHSDGCFFEDEIPADLVFDMVYNPLETVLLKRARAQGKTVIQGLEMFLEQAAAQFEIWTGETAPRAVMQRAVLQAIRAK